MFSPLTGTLDLDGNELILDSDGDTSITASVDDQIDIRVGGADDFQITANKFDVLAGSTLKVTGIETLTKGSDVASATDLLVNIDGNIFDVTGTTTIVTIATKGVGTVIKLHFDAALTLTHHATNLILPGEANITTAAGDEAEFYEYASADWRCTKYTKASGQPVTQIATASIENLAVDTAQLAADAVTTVKITDANVTGSKIAMGSDAQGDVLYYNGTNYVRLAKGTNGQFLKIGATIPAWATVSTLETEQATTSGTEFDFTSIAAEARRITIMFNGVSLDGTDNLLIQIGDSGGIETTGYVSGSVSLSSTSGFLVSAAAAARALSGHMVLTLKDAANNEWISSHSVWNTATGVGGGGHKELSGTLDRVRLTRTGTDTFDAGSVNILIE